MENQVTGEQAFTPNTNNLIRNCLFYNNMTNVLNDHYRYDVTVFNPNNQFFVIMNNVFYFREKTAGGATVDINAKYNNKYSAYGPEREGMSGKNNEMICSNDLPSFEDVLDKHGMWESAREILPLDKTWYHYTDEGAEAFAKENATSEPEETVTEEQESTSATEKESNTENATESETSSDSTGKAGCKASVGASSAVAIATAIAVTAMKKKKKDD
jgi:hypothetical protein